MGCNKTLNSPANERNVELLWIFGHSGSTSPEKADDLARLEARSSSTLKQIKEYTSVCRKRKIITKRGHRKWVVDKPRLLSVNIYSTDATELMWAKTSVGLITGRNYP